MIPLQYRYVTLIVVVVLLLCVSAWLARKYYTEPTTPVDFSYLDTTKQIDARVELLLKQMTLREKIGQMALVEKNSVPDLDDLARYGIGGVLCGSGAKPDPNTPEGWRTMTDSFKDAARESRLKIPLLFGADAIHGHGNVPGATVFPHAIGLGAANDTSLMSKIAQVTAQEMYATGVNWNYAPSLDLPKDMRWGRVYEAFGDDPTRVAALGRAFVVGSQSTTSSEVFVMATPKHFVGNGSMIWGKSFNKDFRIDQGVTPDDVLALRRVYLPPFQAAIQAGALSIMSGLNSWGDGKMSASHYLLTDVLKGELGFEGFVVSDWYGVYEISKSEYTSVVTGINAGIDMVMLPFDYTSFVNNVERAVEARDISEVRINDAVRRILRAKFVAGLFDETDIRISPSEVVGIAAHRALARTAVAESLVVLKNTGEILPLSASTKHILVAGSGADNAGRQMGAWTVEWQGVDGNWLPGITTILTGIKHAVSSETLVEYDARGVFTDSTHADVGIVVVSEKPYAEGWGDTALPALLPEDIEAIDNVKQKVDRVVVVVLSGRPLIVTDQVADWDAFVAAWLPGSEGAGVADVLFGKKPSVGTLPLPWPASIKQVPITAEGTAQDGGSLLYPRGFGLRI